MSSQTTKRIRVGVVGANPTRGWGSVAHLPALAHLPEFEVVAVATTRQASAQQTADAFGVPLAFEVAEDLAAHPDVDLVVAAVKVPSHAAVIRAALAAGKHVLSEWPLGVDFAETTALSEQATAAGVVHAVGLQGVHSPGARYLRDLIAEGTIGRVESISLLTSGGLGGSRIPEWLAWSTDPAAGVSVLSVTGGHVLATLAEAVGPLRDVSAVVATLSAHTTVIETGQRLPVGTPDQVALVGTLDTEGRSGAVMSVTLQGGTAAAAAGFTLQIVGSDTTLRITPAQPGGLLHMSDWTIAAFSADGRRPVEELVVPQRYRTIPPEVRAGPAANVAALYRDLAHAIAGRHQPHASFDTAVAFHRLITIVQTAARTGQRQQLA
jgi:predicted dehydrogenase